MIDQDALVFLPRARFLRERQIMLIQDCPLDTEVKQKSAFSSQSAALQFAELNKVGATRNLIHASYLLPFRPEKGNIGAVFHQKSLAFDGYVHWPESKKDFILDYVYRELEVLRQEIREVQPSLIICAGKWALYFLTGETTFAETNKSQYGTLLKWRASHLRLSPWWGYSVPHVCIPVLPAASVWQLPEKTAIIKQDYNRIGVLAQAVKDGTIGRYQVREEKFLVKPTFEAATQWMSQLLTELEAGPMKLAFDVETSEGYMDCLGIAKNAVEAICIPFATTETPHYWTEAQETELLALFYEIMLHPNCLHRGQNYLYDMQYFVREFCMRVRCHQDSMIMHHTLFPGMEKALDFLASSYCTVYKYWKDEGKTHKGKTSLERWVYNCRDTTQTYEICDALEQIYATVPDNIREAYNFQQYEVQPALLDLMLRGVRTRQEEKQTLYLELTKVMAAIQEEFDYALTEPINLSSPPQLQAFFYDLLALPIQKDRDSGKPTLNDEAMHTLVEEAEPLAKPFIQLLLEYRSLKVFSSTFLAAKADIDGRMRCSYNPCGTDTFRLSSTKNAFGSGLNLQNVPSGGTTDLGYILPNVRALFIPDPGMIFFDIDLDSADLRIVVAESGARDLQQMFNEGVKPYIALMQEYYRDNTKNKYSPEYRIFKGFCHGTNYLGSAKGLAGRLGLLVHEVDILQRWYLGRNPEIAAWHKELKKQIDKRGWIENVFGYRRYFFNKREPTLYQIGAAWKPQSTVGILINRGMVNIRHNLTDVKVLLQVHDSLAGQFSQEKLYLQEEIIKQCSIKLPYENPIIIPVDIHTSTESWGKCK